MFKSTLAQPHDHPVKPSGHRVRKLVTALTILVVLWPYTVSFGDEGVSFTLINRTSHYLHAVINGKSFVYIAPGGVVAYQLDAYANVTADVSYSPGQDIKGKTSKTFQAVVVDSYSNDCSDNGHGNTCGSTGSKSVSPITWTVTPSDLSSN
ncbi:MAG: hypothetical protein HY033_08890 [Ignavibacteriae bacterium]|nr:hypothetical protein [Ignavibacteria bacterium]MBI3365007.1 hypothetical protein [Ignavibacteriota bacterium]